MNFIIVLQEIASKYGEGNCFFSRSRLGLPQNKPWRQHSWLCGLAASAND